MTATPDVSPGSRHPIVVRKPGFDFDAVPRHWLAESPFATHVFNGMNLVFPDGERFFIRSVRDHLDRIDDPELRAQVKGFFGQEGRHAHEHERYFEVLEKQGYRVEIFLRRFRKFIDLSNRLMPASLRLSMTAGAEHYTATFGVMALQDPAFLGSDPTMFKLVAWHATEEIEHKAVAYDVLQATHPSYALRVLGFALATLALFGWSIAGTRMLIRQDLAAGRTDKETLRAHKRAFEGKGASAERLAGRRMVRARIRDYLRRDFHPNDTDDLPLAYQRMAELGVETAA